MQIHNFTSLYRQVAQTVTPMALLAKKSNLQPISKKDKIAKIQALARANRYTRSRTLSECMKRFNMNGNESETSPDILNEALVLAKNFLKRHLKLASILDNGYRKVSSGALSVNLSKRKEIISSPEARLQDLEYATDLIVTADEFAISNRLERVNISQYSIITDLLVEIGANKEFSKFKYDESLSFKEEKLTYSTNFLSYLELVIKNARANISIIENKSESSDQASQNLYKLIELIEKFDLRNLPKSSEKADRTLFENVSSIKQRWIQIERPLSQLANVSGNFKPLSYVKVSQIPEAK